MDNQATISRLQAFFEQNSDSQVFARLADLLFQNKEYNQALKVLKIGLKNYPTYISGHIVLGKILVHFDKLDKAQSEYLKVLSLDPNNVIALKALSEIAKTQNNLEDAASYLRKIITIAPFYGYIKNELLEISPEYASEKNEDDIDKTSEIEIPIDYTGSEEIPPLPIERTSPENPFKEDTENVPEIAPPIENEALIDDYALKSVNEEDEDNTEGEISKLLGLTQGDEEDEISELTPPVNQTDEDAMQVEVRDIEIPDKDETSNEDETTSELSGIDSNPEEFTIIQEDTFGLAGLTNESKGISRRDSRGTESSLDDNGDEDDKVSKFTSEPEEAWGSAEKETNNQPISEAFSILEGQTPLEKSILDLTIEEQKDNQASDHEIEEGQDIGEFDEMEIPSLSIPGAGPDASSTGRKDLQDTEDKTKLEEGLEFSSKEPSDAPAPVEDDLATGSSESEEQDESSNIELPTLSLPGEKSYSEKPDESEESKRREEGIEPYGEAETVDAPFEITAPEAEQEELVTEIIIDELPDRDFEEPAETIEGKLQRDAGIPLDDKPETTEELITKTEFSVEELASKKDSGSDDLEPPDDSESGLDIEGLTHIQSFRSDEEVEVEEVEGIQQKHEFEGGGPEIVTETLAEIYTEQKHYNKAIEIYKRLMLDATPQEQADYQKRINELEKKQESDY
ncbi:hypothetical protein JW877_00045 [bacterium]|nr:hypothetical protein [bacterium]